MQQLVHRLLHLVFHHHFQHDEVDAAIHIFAACSEAGVFYFLHDTVFEGIVQVEVAGYLGGESRFLLSRNQVGQIVEIIAYVCFGIEAYRMGSVLYTAVKASFLTILIDGIQIEIDCGDNS